MFTAGFLLCMCLIFILLSSPWVPSALANGSEGGVQDFLACQNMPMPLCLHREGSSGSLPKKVS